MTRDQEREANKIEVAAIRERLKKEATWSYPIHDKGGQHVGLHVPEVTLTSEEMGFSITISYGRSKTRNMEMALTLFDLYIGEIIK